MILSREAKVEFGEAAASKLKLSRDGTKVLWPQPSDDLQDPQNVLFFPFKLRVKLKLIFTYAVVRPPQVAASYHLHSSCDRTGF